jgi:Fic family protein
MQLMGDTNKIDRFDASWATIEKREGQTLKQLKAIATIRSVGASTRIEGSRMTDDEVETLLKNLSISKLEERDQQEVAGYFETLEMIAESFQNIEITESNLKTLHNQLLKYSDKDAWHKGGYKQLVNSVEETETGRVIFQTTAPGFPTDSAMAQLIEWYAGDTKTLALIKAALFVYEFLSIHPFQDGNGRLSRLLGTLLLLKNGYSWIQYVSFEHEIENRKAEYYRVLMQCQRGRPNEEVYPWVVFFLDCLKNIQQQLMEKLKVQEAAAKLSLREKKIYGYLENHPGSGSGQIAAALDMPISTVKRKLTEMIQNKMITATGEGKGTGYSIDGVTEPKKDSVMVFSNDEKYKEITLINQISSITIKKIVLTPLFEWKHPDEWSMELAKSGLYFEIKCYSNDGAIVTKPFMISSFNNPHNYRPVFDLRQPIIIPETLWEKFPYKKEYPIRVTVELKTSVETFNFDVMLIYDEN